MRLLLVLSLVGQSLRLFSFAYLPPLVLSVVTLDWWSLLSFVVAGGITWCAGTLVSRNVVRPKHFLRSEALGVVSGSYVAVCLSSSIPYLFAGLSLPDAMFESMSGVTATGATIFTHFDYSDPLFLWRALTQWMGGLGVIALFVVVLPRLGIAGRQLFFAEASSAPADAVSPQIRLVARKLWILYTTMTALCATLLMANGMAWFDSICHALTTLSAGGFSPHEASISGYANPNVEWVLIGFMWLAGASYPLQLRVYTGEIFEFFRNGEFIFYTSVMVLSSLLLAILILPETEFSHDALRQAAFQVTSLGTSTGYASCNYDLWQDNAKAVLVSVMLIGGCVGSAAGGPKCMRYLLVLKHIARDFKRLLHPRAVLPLLYNSKPISNRVMGTVFTLVGLYLAGYLLLGVYIVIFENTDLVTGFSSALSCLGNIGPGFNLVGPMASFSELSSMTKLVLTAAMCIGRLEIVTVLALLHPHVWTNLKLSRN